MIANKERLWLQFKCVMELYCLNKHMQHKYVVSLKEFIEEI